MFEQQLRLFVFLHIEVYELHIYKHYPYLLTHIKDNSTACKTTARATSLIVKSFGEPNSSLISFITSNKLPFRL